MNTPIEAVVVEYRSASRTCECISALLAQGVERVIVVDNSADNGETAAELGRRLSAAEAKQVMLDRSEQNLGFAAGVNRGISLARARRILVINNDAVPCHGTIGELSHALDESPGALLAFPSLLHAGRPIGEVYYHRWTGLLSSAPKPGAFRLPRGCCMLLDIERLGDTALFDETFFMYGEEVELGWRLRRHPDAMVHVSYSWVTHFGSAAAVRGSRFYEERTAVAHLLLSRILCKDSSCGLLFLSVRLTALLARAAFRSIRSLSLTPAIALLAAFSIVRHQEARDFRSEQPLRSE